MQMLTAGWHAAPAAPDAGAEAPASGSWQDVQVPVTAGALRAFPIAAADLETVDWWFRTEFDAGAAGPDEEVLLHLGGIATVSEVYLNGALLLEGPSMFAEHAVDVSQHLRGANRLEIRCRALAPLLALPRRPRARWRTRLVEDGALRWFRTMLLGRMPGRAPGPPVIGPWRPIWLERRSGTLLDDLRIRTQMRGADGRLLVSGRVRGVGGSTASSIRLELVGPNGRHVLPLHPTGAGTVAGEMVVPNVERWWPHTHGRPTLHDVRLIAHGGTELATARVGFRSIAPGASPNHDLARDGIDLHLNGVQVFCRGAVWVADAARPGSSEDELRTTLLRVREAGMNMLRIPGIGAYESERFHQLCDELGILVWQDLMFASMDYPFADDAFRALAESEVSAVLGRLAAHPSLVVLCGNSEVEQQVAMLGLDPELGRSEFFESTVPSLAAAAGADAIHVRSAPFGGDLPFRNDRGIAHYFGVGGYRRPITDARAARVRFAAMCLAIANLPDDVADPLGKEGVAHDPGSEWDFEDVRDHYLAELFSIDPAALRDADPHRYAALSRAVSGELMAEVFGEWRRAGSGCGGGLVLWLRDLVPGAGWGLLDSTGGPKVAYDHLRRALAAVAVWTTDEGLGGIAVHVANDSAAPLSAVLRVALYRDHEQPVAEASQSIDLSPHATVARDVESLLGSFHDASNAYRFGPPGHDTVVVTLESASGVPISQAFRFPAGRPTQAEPAAALGLEATASPAADGHAAVTVGARRLLYGVRLVAPGFEPADSSFSIEPGHRRVITLRPTREDARFTGATLTALNLVGALAIGGFV